MFNLEILKGQFLETQHMIFTIHSLRDLELFASSRTLLLSFGPMKDAASMPSFQYMVCYG